MGNWYVKVTSDDKLSAIECKGLHDFYAAIDCDTIEIVGSCERSFAKDDIRLIIDDNGKLLNKPINLIASVFYASPSAYGRLSDVIVGDVLFGVLNLRHDDVIGFESKSEALNFGVNLCRLLNVDLVQ